MFTIDQIKEEHSKVKTGADFPKYIQDLIRLGVLGYITHVKNGKVVYYGVNHHRVCSDKKYDTIQIAEHPNKELFIEFLVQHQDGQTDYMTFCQHAGQCGISKWKVDIVDMTCTYLDKNDNPILIEKIPS